MVLANSDQEHILCNYNLHKTETLSQGKIKFKIWIGIFHCVCSNFVVTIQPMPLDHQSNWWCHPCNWWCHHCNWWCNTYNLHRLCCKNVACFWQKILHFIYFVELHVEILMQQLLHYNNKNMLLVKVSLNQTFI